MDIFNVSSDNLFTLNSQKTAQMENLAKRVLSTGLDQFVSKNYDLAITSFKRAISMAPRADSAVNAYDYLARAQLTQGNTRAAIDSYTQALKIDPTRDDLHTQLGKIYTTEGRFEEAREHYELAVKHNPSTANRYSLGQGYLGTGQYDRAIPQFQYLKQLQPDQPYGDFGLGQAYAKQGNHADALAAFKNAVALKNDYLDAYSEMGYVYVDSGQPDLANEIVDTLNTLSPGDTTLASALAQYLFEKSQPKMTATYASTLYTPFLSNLGPRTTLSGMSGYAAAAGEDYTFAMEFQFDKPMDAASVENIFNWNIARAIGSGRADGYNYDMPLPGSEVTPESLPAAVYYNQKEQTATVLFKIRQNAAADGTLDPSHINFSFKGKDVAGLSMDQSADRYSGFSQFA